MSTSTGSESRVPSSSAARTPTQPGRIDDEPTRPLRRSIGPGQAEADARRPAPPSRPPGHHLLDESHRRVEAGLGWILGTHGPLGLGQDRVAEVGGGDAQVALAEVDPDRDPGRAAEREPPRRAAAARRARRAPSSLSTSTPAASSSATMLATVVRDMPVRRASSERLAAPASRSAAVTRSRFRSRRASPEPLPAMDAKYRSLLGRMEGARRV